MILILLSWDDERRKFIAALRASGADVRALLVCAKEAWPPDASGWLTALHPGEIERGLAVLR